MDPRILLSRLLENARRQGARAAEAIYEQSTILGMDWQIDRVGDTRLREERRVHLRAYLAEGRWSPCIIQGPGPDAILDKAEASIAKALARAESASPDPLAGPAERFDLDDRGMGLFDRRHENLRLDDRRDILEFNVEGCEGRHEAIQVASLAYDERVCLRSFASTRGVSASERSTRYDALCKARFGVGGRLLEHRVATRQFANIASMPFGVSLGQRLVALNKPATVPAPDLPVLMAASASAQILRALAPAFAAPAVRSGRTFVSELLGKRIAAAKLHVVDDPGLPGALRSHAFDDRGVPPAPVVIIREGVASGLYFDPRSARQTEIRPTGHSMGGDIQPSNLVLRPGNRSRNAIGMDLGDYLVLDNFHAEQPIDLRDGQLTTACDLLAFRRHELCGGLLGVPIDMHVSRFLGAITEIASDQARYQEVDACTMVLRGLDLLSHQAAQVDQEETELLDHRK